MSKNSLSYEIIGKLTEEIEKIDITNILEAYGVPIRRKGKTQYVECPHCGRDDASSIYKNFIKCFKCDNSTFSINYISKILGTEYKDTVLDIGNRLNLISAEDYEKLTSKSSANNSVREIKIREVKEEEKAIEEDSIEIKADDVILDRVFRVFSKGMSLVGGKKLFDEDKKYLLNRGLTEEEIVYGRYFSMPKSLIMPKLLGVLKEEYLYNEDILKDVPGFYKDKNGKYTFKELNGIGLPIFNSKTQLVGIQVRLTKPFEKIKSNGEKDVLRYIWFSSSKIDDDCSEGTSSGAPVDVYFPDLMNGERLSQILYVTEGKFKAQKLANHTKGICISVQGVGNWRGIIEEVNYLLSKGTPIKKVCICYDGDLIYNPKVNNHAIEMANELAQHIDCIRYCIWDPKYGKGIDDILVNKNSKAIKVLKKDVYEEKYLHFINNLEEENIDFASLKKEKREELFKKYVLAKL